MEIFKNFLSQIILTVGVIVVFGLLIALCRRLFCLVVGRSAPKILLATGIVGTPIHELSHALMCLIFGHKIVEMKLYQPDSDDGTLGYVQHSYNKKNLYHQIGNFFIGIAPILCGSGVLLLLMYLLIPDTCSDVMMELRYIDVSYGLLDPSTYGAYLSVFWEFISAIFSPDNLGDIRWWIYIVLAIMISGHMELSPADIKGSAVGLVFLSTLLLVVDAILYLISLAALESVTAAMASFSVSIVSFLAISVVFSLLSLVIALAVTGIVRLVIRR